MLSFAEVWMMIPLTVCVFESECGVMCRYMWMFRL